MTDVNSRKNRFLTINPLSVYFTVTFLISWLCWGISFTFKSPGVILDRFWLISQIGVFAPSITAIAFYSLQNRNNLVRKSLILFPLYIILIVLGITVTKYAPTDLTLLPKWLATVIILMAIITFLYLLFQRQILHTTQTRTFSFTRLSCVLLSSWIFYPILFLIIWLFIHSSMGNPSISIIQKQNTPAFFLIVLTIAFDFLFGGSIGEEIGWRGYALPLLLKKYNPIKASLILGIIWSLWHLPIGMTAGFGMQGIGGVVLRIVTVCPMSIIITWFYIHSRFGVITSLLLHSGLNMIPAMGFSNYEITFGILILLQLFISLIILSCDKAFGVRYVSQQQDQLHEH